VVKAGGNPDTQGICFRCRQLRLKSDLRGHSECKPCRRVGGRPQ
jgi:hypothetical protein